MDFEIFYKTLKISDSYRRYLSLKNAYFKANQIIKDIQILKIFKCDNDENFNIYKNNIKILFKNDVSNINTFDDLIILLSNLMNMYEKEANNIVIKEFNDVIKEDIQKNNN